jgi:hypothetical protein
MIDSTEYCEFKDVGTQDNVRPVIAPNQNVGPVINSPTSEVSGQISIDRPLGTDQTPPPFTVTEQTLPNIKFTAKDAAAIAAMAPQLFGDNQEGYPVRSVLQYS